MQAPLLCQVSDPRFCANKELVEGFASFTERMPEGGPDTTARRLVFHSFMTQFKVRRIDPVAAMGNKVVNTLTPGEIGKVLEQVRPKITAIINDPKSQWDGGPAGVRVHVVNCFGESYQASYGSFSPPQPTWDDFLAFARSKGMVSLAEQKPSEECQVVGLIKHDTEDRNWKGGICRSDLGIGASGLTEEADKRVAIVVGEALEEAKAELNKPETSANTCALN